MSDKDLKALYNVLDAGTEDPYIYGLMTQAHNRLVRSDFEFQVAEVLEHHPITMQIRGEIREALAKAIFEYKVQHLAGGAKALKPSKAGAKDGQYADILEMTQDIAQAMGFPKKARDNADVFFLGDNTVNAYTFSAEQDAIIAAVFAGLWDLFGKDMKILRPVMLHELQHIMGRHIAMRAELLTIFLSTGIDLIPDVDITSLNGDEFQEALVERGFQHLAPVLMSLKNLGSEIVKNPLVRGVILQGIQARGFALNSHEAEHEESKYAQEFNSALSQRILNIALDLRKKVSHKDRMIVSKKLMKLLGESVSYSEDEGDGGSEGPMIDFKAYKAFLEKLDGVLSRAKEKTSDHATRIWSASSEEAAMPFVRMKGGKDATYEGMLRVNRELDQIRQEHPEFAHEGGSHPDIGERIEYMELYSTTDGFKIASDPFLKNVYFYLLLSQEITEQEKAVKTDFSGAVRQGLAKFKMDKVKAFADKLGNWIRQQLHAEYASAMAAIDSMKTSADVAKLDGHLQKFGAFVDILQSGQDGYYFDYFYQQQGRRQIAWADWLKEFSRPNRLPYDLLQDLVAEAVKLDATVVTAEAGPLAAEKLMMKANLIETSMDTLKQMLPYEAPSEGQRFFSQIKMNCEAIVNGAAQG